jgi:hypothetical protein
LEAGEVDMIGRLFRWAARRIERDVAAALNTPFDRHTEEALAIVRADRATVADLLARKHERGPG